jgi:hypothetical protein
MVIQIIDSRLIRIWTRVFCLAIQTAQISLAMPLKINYYICSGQDPTEDYRNKTPRYIAYKAACTLWPIQLIHTN